MQEELCLTIRNDLGELVRVSVLAGELLERCQVSERVSYAAQLALEEVLSNVIRHGYPDGAAHEIALKLRVAEGGVEFEVVDDGREFDPTQAAPVQLDAPLSQRKAGGLGIHLLRSFVSEIRYERRGERNALWVRI